MINSLLIGGRRETNWEFHEETNEPLLVRDWPAESLDHSANRRIQARRPGSDRLFSPLALPTITVVQR